jgi:SAM-dependent methyltransferase
MTTAAIGQFQTLVDLVCKKSPLQKKKLAGYLLAQDSEFFSEAEQFAARYRTFLDAQGISIEEAVNAYLKMCSDMMRCQVAFMRTGRYPTLDAASATEHVYHNPREMVSYMIGLAISQFLWETHRAMFQFFSRNIHACAANIQSYLEIGPGHGLFLDRALADLRPSTAVTVVDISPTSMQITRSIMEHFRPEARSIKYENADILDLPINETFDFITMGEVLEHVDVPDTLLKKLHLLLSPEGRAFISTCANCPALDHVYQFNNVGEIREMIRTCGLDIEEDAALPVEKLPMTEIVEKKITINYCAMVKRHGSI